MRKTIDVTKKQQSSIMDANIRKKIEDRLKINFSLFGVADHFYIDEFIFIMPDDTMKPLFSRRSRADRCVNAISIVSEDDNMALDHSSESIKSLCIDSYKAFGKDINTFSIVNLSKGDDNKIFVNAGIKYSEQKDKDIVESTTVSTEGSFEYNSDKAYIAIATYSNIKAAPLIRIKELSLHGCLEYFNKHLVNPYDFDNKDNFIYNSYGFDAEVEVIEEKKTFNSSGQISTMTYKDKGREIFQYLDHEKVDIDECNVSYTSDFGISCESFYSPARNKYQLKYNGKVLKGFESEYDDDGNISRYNDMYVSTYKKGFESEYDDGNISSCDDMSSYENDEYTAYIESNCHKLEDTEVIERFTSIINNLLKKYFDVKILPYYSSEFYSDNNENRLFCNAMVHNDTTLFIKYFDAQLIDDKYIAINISRGFSTIATIDRTFILFDIDKDILVFHKHTEYGSFTDNGTYFIKEKTNYENCIGMRYILINTRDANSKLVRRYFSGIEGNFEVSFNEDETHELTSIDSLLYNSLDEKIYIRDEFGIPSDLYKAD